MSLVGQRIGRFKVGELLGKGAMGEVFIGKDELLERSVALKSIRNLNPIQDLAKTRFLREAKALSKLKHPSICQIFDIIEAPENLILVLEFIDGETVRAALEKNLVDKELALRIAVVLCEVLKMAHDKKIVHRDLKPDNLMIAKDGQIKVLDFGLVRLLDDENDKTTSLFTAGHRLGNDSGLDNKTLEGSVVGTVGYLSPEQARGEHATAASDMYTVGVILCELLTGKRPYPEDIRYPAIIFYIGKGRRLPIEQLAPQLEPELQRLLEGLLSLDPDSRPTASQALESLAHFRNHLPKRQIRRYFRYAVGGAALLFLLWFSLFQRKSPVEPLLQPSETARIAILPFKIHSSDNSLEWAPLGLLQLLNESLQQQPLLEVISAQRILDQTGGLAEEPERIQVSRTFGVPLVAVPTIHEKNHEFQVSFELFYQGVSVDQQSFQAANIYEVVEKLAKLILDRIWLEYPELQLHGTLSAQNTVNLDYVYGLSRTLGNNGLTACSYFEICLERDASFDRAKLALARCSLDTGDPQRALQLLQEVLESARRQSDPKLQVESLQAIAQLKLQQNSYAEAESLLREAWQLLDANASRELCAEVLNSLGKVSVAAGDFSQARDNYENALDILTQISDLHAQVETYMQMGKMARSAGNITEAEAFFRKALVLSEETFNNSQKNEALLNMVLLKAASGKRDSADEFWQQLLARVRHSGELAALVQSGLGNQRRVASEQAKEEDDLDMLAYVLLSQVSREQQTGNWEGSLFFIDELKKRSSPVLEDANAKFLLLRQAVHDGDRSQIAALKFELEVRMGVEWFNRDPARKAIYASIQ